MIEILLVNNPFKGVFHMLQRRKPSHFHFPPKTDMSHIFFSSLPEILCKPLALLWWDRGLSFCFQGSCSRLIFPQLHLIWDHEMMQNDGRTILDCHGSYWFKSSGRWTNFAVCILLNYACPTVEKAELKFHHVSQLRCSLEEMSEHLKVYTA